MGGLHVQEPFLKVITEILEIQWGVDANTTSYARSENSQMDEKHECSPMLLADAIS